MKIKLTTLSLLALIVSYANAQTPKYENLNSAVSTLSSYYDAVNQKDYRRAYGYWQTPTDSYQNFVKGYAETQKVRLIVEPPTRIEGAAGSLYAEIPTVLIASQKGGKQQIFAGCYMMRKSNLQSPDATKNDVWHIYRANLKTAPADAEIPTLLAESCAGNTNSNSENQSARVPGVIGFDSKKLSDAISVPATIEANKDFQITVTTSGNGCFNAGDTSVILGDSSADVFVYDLTTATNPGTVCTMIFKQFKHTATLRFTKPGPAIIRVWGREQGGDAPFGKPVVAELRVTVK